MGCESWVPVLSDGLQLQYKQTWNPQVPL